MYNLNWWEACIVANFLPVSVVTIQSIKVLDVSTCIFSTGVQLYIILSFISFIISQLCLVTRNHSIPKVEAAALTAAAYPPLPRIASLPS